MHKTPTALAYKPSRELENANALILARFSIISIRRPAKVISVFEIEIVMFSEAVSKARLFDRVDAQGCVPRIEAADSGGPCRW